MSDFEQWWSGIDAIPSDEETFARFVWQAAIASMQGEAIGFFGGHRHYPQGTSEFFGWVYDADLRIEKGTKLFTYPPSDASKIAEQDARIKELEQQLEVARKLVYLVNVANHWYFPSTPISDVENHILFPRNQIGSTAPLWEAIDAAIRQIGGAE